MTQYAHIVLSWLLLSCFLYRYSLGNSENNSVKCLDRERKALLQFKDGITQDSCGLLTSWGDDIDCCHWHGVHCSNDTSHVIMLHLQGSNQTYPGLAGNLSPSLIVLRHLRHLNLSFNYFFQPIPDFLGSLANLEYLSLGYSFYYGEETTPRVQSLQWLSRLRLLSYLDLSGADLSHANNWAQIVFQLPFLRVLHMDDCQLPGNIPSSLTHINPSSNLRVITLSNSFFANATSVFQWLFNLPQITTQLEYLDFSYNCLESLIPNSFRNLEHLLHLDLSFNQLSHIPNGLENLHHLSHLDLKGNELEGPIPKNFGNLQNLLYLDLSNNNFEGPIPSEFQNIHSISYLSLSDNQFQGSVYKIFRRLCNLQKLNLGDNNFTDELTDVIRALLSCENTKLMTLDLSQNRFWGGIPDTISSFSLLRELYLDGNQLSGNITQSIGQLAMLEKLYLSSNSLEATLTHTHFLNLSRLRELSLSENTRIVINTDASWDPPFQLDIISLRSCKLGPYFPNWLKMQTNFSYLDVFNAEISDNIPVSFWKSLSPNLQYLNMSYNQFYGVIPNLPQTFGFIFEVLDLSSNLFEGAIPSWFRNISFLYLNDNRFSDFSYIFRLKTRSYFRVVHLSNNLLSGELPDGWMNVVQIGSLHLENNRLSGNIPKSFGALKYLKYLHLQNNSFSGAIPASLENCTNLFFLNLGYNSFTGNIPPWIGNLQSLGALILRRNNFLGEVSASLCRLPFLHILDFAMNHISGVIPGCISNLTAMKSNVPFWPFSYAGTLFGRQPSLKEDETSIVMWKREEREFKESVALVKSIDFSFNEMGGEIPDGIFYLTGLVSLDLSKNNVSGSISSKVGQLAALELLGLSDNHLTGEIPASLSNLSSLAILDLSNNNLSGKIPVGTQMQGFDASSFTGNHALCGAPLSLCPGDQTPVDIFNEDNTSVQHEHDDKDVLPGLYISVVLGLIIGFWGVFGTLVIKNSWRYAWFSLLDSIQDRFCEIAIYVVAKAWNKP